MSEIIFDSISEIIFSAYRENVIGQDVKHIDATCLDILAGLFYFFVRRAMLYIYIYIYIYVYIYIYTYIHIIEYIIYYALDIIYYLGTGLPSTVLDTRTTKGYAQKLCALIKHFIPAAWR